MLLKFESICTDGCKGKYELLCTLKTDTSKKLVFCHLLMKIPPWINQTETACFPQQVFWRGRKVRFSLLYSVSLINWANEQSKLKVTLHPFSRTAYPCQKIEKRIIHSTVRALITVTDVNIIIIVIFCSSCSTTSPVHLLPCFDYCSASIILGSIREEETQPFKLTSPLIARKLLAFFFFSLNHSDFFHWGFFVSFSSQIAQPAFFLICIMTSNLCFLTL